MHYRNGRIYLIENHTKCDTCGSFLYKLTFIVNKCVLLEFAVAKNVVRLSE